MSDTTRSAWSGPATKFTATFAPASASALATPSPMPELAPVTSARWPSSTRMLIIFCSALVVTFIVHAPVVVLTRLTPHPGPLPRGRGRAARGAMTGVSARAEVAAADEVVDGQPARAMQQRDEQQPAPEFMLQEPGLGQAGIGDHGDDVEHEQRSRGA